MDLINLFSAQNETKQWRPSHPNVERKWSWGIVGGVEEQDVRTPLYYPDNENRI
jgi:hypothetical protein